MLGILKGLRTHMNNSHFVTIDEGGKWMLCEIATFRCSQLSDVEELLEALFEFSQIRFVLVLELF